jgi:hypothetical protein
MLLVISYLVATSKNYAKLPPNLLPDDATGNDMICGTFRRGLKPPSHS